MGIVKFMFKSLLAILLVGLAVVFYGIYSARALPEWFDESQANDDFANQAINKQLNNGGVDLLAQKSLDILRGRVSFNEEEFNALLLAGLKSDPDGRKLLSVSDGIRAFLHNGEVELSAVINLNKLAKVEPKAKEAIDKFNKLFWVVEGDRMAVTVFGVPTIRKGGLGVTESFRAKVGEIAFSNDTLRSLKVPVEQARTTYVEMDFLHLKSVKVSPNKIDFGVSPKF